MRYADPRNRLRDVRRMDAAVVLLATAAFLSVTAVSSLRGGSGTGDGPLAHDTAPQRYLGFRERSVENEARRPTRERSSRDGGPTDRIASALPAAAIGAVGPTVFADKAPAANEAGEDRDSAAANGEDAQPENPAELTLPAMTIFGDREATSLDDRVGPYDQPAWTARNHRFPTTRAYVLPPNTYQLTVWGVGEFSNDIRPTNEIIEEVEIGLPYRFQLDLYYTQTREPDQEGLHEGAQRVELRWAIADWGEIPLNPTLYAEWENEGDEDAVEYKLLLAENLAPRWHWGGNLVYEQKYSGERDTELGVSSGLSYTVVDPWLSAGAEAEIFRKTQDGARNPGDAEWESLVGPSVEVRPIPSVSLVFAPLAGLGPDSPDLKTFILLEWTFGTGSEIRSGPEATEIR